MICETGMLNIQKGLFLQEKARKRIPGMTQLLSKRPDRFSLGVWPGYFSRAKGAEVWDLDGNKYVDMSIGGIGANGREHLKSQDPRPCRTWGGCRYLVREWPRRDA